jgi:tetratricopeptide (TPR) repeat protein
MIEDYSEEALSDSVKSDMERQVEAYYVALRRREHSLHKLPSADIVDKLVEYCIDNAKYDEALEFCNLWVEYYPQSFTAHNTLSSILICLSRFAEAMIEADVALELSPLDSEALLNKAAALDGTGKQDEAEALLKQLLEMYPDEENALGYLSMIYRRQDRYEEALPLVEKLTQLDDECADYQLSLALCYDGLSDVNNAIEHTKAAIDLEPYDDSYWYNLGVCYLNADQTQYAIESFNMSLAINEEAVSALVALAKIYLEAEDYHKATEFYQRALAIRPNDVDILSDYAILFASIGDYVQAINYFLRAIQDYPLNFRALLGLASCYAVIGKMDKALQYYDAILTTRPNDRDILLMKGNFLLSVDRYDEAEQIFLNLRNAYKEEAIYAFSLGKCYFCMGDYDSAMNELFIAITLEVSLVEKTDTDDDLASCVLFWIAKIYALRNEYSKSAAMLLKSFNIMPEREIDYLSEFPDLLKSNYSNFHRVLRKLSANS